MPNGLLMRRGDEHVEVAHDAGGVVEPGDVLDLRRGADLGEVVRIQARGVVADDHDAGAGRAGADRRRGDQQVDDALAGLDAPDEADDRAVAGRPGRVGGRRVELDRAVDDVGVEAVEAIGDGLRVGEHHVGLGPVARNAVDHVVDVQHRARTRSAGSSRPATVEFR